LAVATAFLKERTAKAVNDKVALSFFLYYSCHS